MSIKSIYRMFIFPGACALLLCLAFFVNARAASPSWESTEDLLLLEGITLAAAVQPEKEDLAEVGAESDKDLEQAQEVGVIADPLEPINRVFFHFNDKLYFWILKPLAKGYNKVVPEPLRVGVRNFFSNLGMPIRAVNCLLQGKVDSFGNEVGRFFANTFAGALGFIDTGKIACNIGPQEEDLGQTFGFFGVGPGIFIDWPFLGPSSLRDTVGLVGDGFLNPVYYVVSPIEYTIGVKAYETLNNTSLTLGDYEALKKAALDPYVSMRDAYYQYREAKIKE
jgi:phospholipid-binding lipoprotein MlaA